LGFTCGKCDKRNEQLFLCHSAIKESHNVLRNKINEVMVDIIRFLPDIYQSSSISTMDSQAFLIDQFKNLKAAKPGLTNFLNLVYHEISIFLKDNEIDDLPDFLSELSLNLSNSIIFKIEETHQDFEILFLNHDRLNNVKKSLAEIHFKDTNDGRIFQELMTNLEDIKPIEFFLDDRDFAKKCDLGLQISLMIWILLSLIFCVTKSDTLNFFAFWEVFRFCPTT